MNEIRNAGITAITTYLNANLSKIQENNHNNYTFFT